MPKTPSPKVVAAYVLREILTNAPAFSAADMQSLVDSKISDAKRQKVADQIQKMTLKLRQRMEGTIHKFENPQPRKKKE